MRLTFEAVEKFATKKGLHIERRGTGTNVDVWANDAPDTVATCEDLQEAYDTVYHYEKGKPL